MEDLFNSAINHLEQLVSFDTSNPPRAISESLKKQRFYSIFRYPSDSGLEARAALGDSGRSWAASWGMGS